MLRGHGFGCGVCEQALINTSIAIITGNIIFFIFSPSLFMIYILFA
jgi:hypothetical protein